MAFLFFAYGGFSAISQLLLIRELAFLSGGQELALGLCLAGWIFWSALGVHLQNKMPIRDFAPLSIIVFSGLASPAALIAARFIAAALNQGMEPDIAGLAAIGLIAPACAALPNGLLAGLLLRSAKPSKFYVWESLGACFAGLLYSFYLAGRVPPVFLAALSYCLLAAAGTANFQAPRFKSVIFTVAGITLAFFLSGLENATLMLRFPNLKPETAAETPYGRIMTASAGGTKILIENGYITGQLPAPQITEPAAHLPLLAHPAPKNALLIGSGALLCAPEAAKQLPDSAITAVEPDIRKFNIISGMTGFKTILINQDSRSFFPLNKTKYDVIILNPGDPVNAAQNRFFTGEFFALVKTGLAPGGLLAFTLPSSENHLPRPLLMLESSVIQAASSAFRHTACIPGERITILLSDAPLELSPARLAGRYHERKISSSYLTPETLPFILMPERREWLAAALAKTAAKPNTDAEPAAYLYYWRTWAAKYSSPAVILAAIMMAGLLFALAYKKRTALAALPPQAFEVAAVAFWSITAEICLLLVFQYHYGALYWQLGTLFAAFTAGIAAGGISAKKANRVPPLFFVLILAASAPAVYAAPPAAASPAAGLAIFCFLSACAGAATGFAFSACANAQPEQGGVFYIADLAGGFAGSALTSALLIPALGIKIAYAAGCAPIALILILKLIRK